MKRLLLTCLIITASLLTCSSKAHAQTLAYDFTIPGSALSTNDERGWAFTPTKRINITALGMYAHLDAIWSRNPDFFEVRLWDDATGLQFGSGFVGGGDSLEGFFRFRDLSAPITLSAGETYVVSAHMQLQSFASGSSIIGFATAADIEFTENRSNLTPGKFPSLTSAPSDPGYFGPNFKYVVIEGDFTWTNPSGGDFSDGANWDLGAPPVSTDNAVFDRIGGGTYTVNFTESATNNFFEVRGGSHVVFNLNGNNYTTSGKTTIEHNSLGAANVLTVQGGGILTTGELDIAETSGFQGQLIISGPNTQWDATGGVKIGFRGVGSLTVEEGATATSSSSTTVGFEFSDGSSANIKGLGSTWQVNNSLTVGNTGDASMTIEDGGVVTSNSGNIAFNFTSMSTVTVKDPMSAWNINGLFQVGGRGDASLLIENGGTVTSTGENNIAVSFGSVSDVTVRGADARWNANGELRIGNEGNGSLLIDGGATAIASSVTDIGFADGSQGNVMVSGLGSQWDVNSILNIGSNGIGSLTVENGASVVVKSIVTIGAFTSSDGSIAVIKGSGSTLEGDSFWIVGNFGDASMTIEDGGVVTSGLGYIGLNGASTSTVTVKDPLSAWNVNTIFQVGTSGDASLRIENGGSVTSTGPSTIARFSASDSDVTVTDAGSSWHIDDDLSVGADGTAQLNIENEGLVAVTGTTTIGPSGTINLDNARFEFGTMTYEDFNRINASGGSMAGHVLISGFNDVSTRQAPSTIVNISDVALANSGVLYGNANLRFSLANQPAGEVRIGSGQWIRFGGTTSTNSGAIKNAGGTVEFSGLTNNSGAIVLGRGIFELGDNSVNRGVFAFSGGFADVHGDLTNDGGTIAIAGGSTTTFYDDVTDAGGVIDVAAGSRVVFFGSYNGGTTGPGTADISGDLRPGNSPAAVSFGGALNIAASATVHIEIGGLTAGDDYDQINVAGNVSLDGTLDIEFIDGFSPSCGDVFELMTFGSRTGDFSQVVISPPGHDASIDLSLSEDRLILTGTSSVVGDLTCNGFVDFQDLTVLLANWNKDATVLEGNLVGPSDTPVNFQDLTILLAAWTGSPGAAGSPEAVLGTEAVPEPSALVLAALGLLGLCGFARRRTRRRAG